MVIRAHDRSTILVVDPCQDKVEDEAYSNLLGILDDIRGLYGMPALSLRFWVPCRGGRPKLDDVFRTDPTLLRTLSGCIILGSYAHITEENRHPWIGQLDRLLNEFIVPRKLPCLAICFGHQLLAHRRGAKVDYLAHKELAGFRYHSEGLRRIKIVSKRFQLMTYACSNEDWSRKTAHVQDYQLVLRALRLGQLSESSLEYPLSPAELAATRILKMTSDSFEAWSRHWQAVLPFISSDRVRNLLVAATSVEVPVEALVDTTLPIFSLQTHPERPLTEDSGFFLRNFMLLCGTAI